MLAFKTLPTKPSAREREGVRYGIKRRAEIAEVETTSFPAPSA